jgi:3-methyl-2-oxobutanoate hydroxymethyltransferase
VPTTAPKPLPQRVTAPAFAARKGKGRALVMVTAYDAPQGRLADAAGVDAVLVGDSLGMTTLGYDTTLPVTLDDILLHTRAVRRGIDARAQGTCPDAAPTDAERARSARHALLVADLPFGTYGATVEEGVRAGMRLVSEGGAEAVKLEGAGPVVVETIRRLVDVGVPVMAHVGMTPQSVHRFGGFKVQGRSDAAADAVLADAVRVAEAGAFAMVLEVIPAALSGRITEAVPVPTIGIGAGPLCDGQVQVLHDLIGLTPGPALKHARRYAEVGAAVEAAVAAYAADVRAGRFPSAENSF